MGVLDRGVDRRRRRGSFRGKCEASHCTVTNGALMRSCAEVRVPIELSSRMVSWVGLGIRVLDEVPRASRGREVLKIFRFRWFEWRIFERKYIRLVREKLRIFQYGQYIVGIDGSLAFRGQW